MEDQLRPLTNITDGEKVILVKIDAGRGLKSRLASMGLLPQTEITVISNKHPGPFMISVKKTKMMLGRGMADKIMVR
ncbi:MAG: FeoA family protein [Planctomycetota bacterium]|jgi:Fe2+ transport system protein FeoA